MSEDFYATLGVAPTASEVEIERAYRRLARVYHPDLLRQASSEERHAAEERLKAINRAHHSLGDRERRAAYDRQRRQARAGSRPVPAARARPTAPHGVRPASVGAPRPGAARSTHRAGGGPLDIAWATAPSVAPRPMTDLFTVGRLLRYALAIILFALLLGLLWHPTLAPPTAPTPTPSVDTTAH